MFRKSRSADAGVRRKESPRNNFVVGPRARIHALRERSLPTNHGHAALRSKRSQPANSSLIVVDLSGTRSADFGLRTINTLRRRPNGFRSKEA
jgi:hypothetical protein